MVSVKTGTVVSQTDLTLPSRKTGMGGGPYRETWGGNMEKGDGQVTPEVLGEVPK